MLHTNTPIPFYISTNITTSNEEMQHTGALQSGVLMRKLSKSDVVHSNAPSP